MSSLTWSIRAAPLVLAYPLFLVLFGVGDRTKISVAAFGAALVILFNVAYGVMNARKTRLLAAKAMAVNINLGAFIFIKVSTLLVIIADALCAVT